MGKSLIIFLKKSNNVSIIKGNKEVKLERNIDKDIEL